LREVPVSVSVLVHSAQCTVDLGRQVLGEARAQTKTDTETEMEMETETEIRQEP
jgi:hypothetical protein